MPPALILDPATIDCSNVVASAEAIMACNPQRFEFRLLDAIVLVDEGARIFAGYHDLREDDWWVRGHIPGRPLFPGVLMIEAAAQLASYMAHHAKIVGGFLGFAGVDKVKFRGAVTPPARFLVVGQGVSLKSRRVICNTQGFVGRDMVFEGEITGMPV